MNCETRPLDLDQIDFTSSEFRITTRRDVENLLPSLESLGLIHPPTCIRNRRNWNIVVGFRRLEACRRLGWRQVDARVVPARAETGVLAQLAVYDNALQRTLNLIEISRAYRLLGRHLQDPERVAAAAGAAGLPASPKFMARVSPLCELPDPVQEGVVSGAIALPTAERIATFDTPTGRQLGRVLNELQLSLNRQRELMTLLFEIGHRDNIPILGLLTTGVTAEILGDSEADRRNKTKRLLSELRARRYPQLTRVQRRWRERVGRLDLGEKMQMIPPAGFEALTYRLTLSFATCEDLKNLGRRVSSMAASADMAKVLSRNPVAGCGADDGRTTAAPDSTLADRSHAKR